MDPVTTIGLLASLAELIKVSNQVLVMVRRFRDGEGELKDLSNDITIFAELLKGCDRVLRSRQTTQNISPIIIQRAIDEGLTSFRDLQSHLDQITSSNSSTVRRLKWMQSRSHHQKLHARFKTQIEMLQAFVSLAHTETFLATVGEHILLTGSSLESSESPSSLPRIPSTSSNHSSRSSLEVPIRSVSPDSSTSLLPKSPPTGMPIHCGPVPIILQACRFDCYCICHRQSVDLTAEMSGRRRSRGQYCDQPTCAGMDDSIRTKLNSFRDGLWQILSSKSIKVRYDIKPYRMVSEGSDAMRYTKYGDLENLKDSLDRGEATLWDTAPDGWSLLHTAVYHKHLPIVKYLLQLGIRTEEGDVGSRRPLDLAILKSLTADATPVEKEIVEVFSEKDDFTVDFEFTPIHIAVLDLYDPTDSDRPTVQQLIELVDDANNAPAGTNWDKWKVRYRKRSPLFGQVLEYFRATAYEMPKTHKIIHNLIDRKDKKYCWTPLHWASSAGKADKMRILLQYGADPFLLDNLGASILHAASESMSAAGLKVGLEISRRHPERLDVNQRNHWKESPLHVAAWGSLECVKLLLAAGADRNVRQEDGQVPLHHVGLSVKSATRRQIASLLCRSGGLDINARDVGGRSPVFDFLNDAECVEMLHSHGARLDLVDASHKSLFHHACIQNEAESLKTLLRLTPNSATAIAKDDSGNTPILAALDHSHIECAQTLLELDDIGDIIGSGGWAAIHYASKIGDVGLLKSVVQHGSFKRGIKTDDGKTAAVVAMEAGNWRGEVKALLRMYDIET